MLNQEFVAALKRHHAEPDELVRDREREVLLLPIGEYLNKKGVSYKSYQQSFFDWEDANFDELESYSQAPADGLATMFDYLLSKCATLTCIERIFHLEFLKTSDLLPQAIAHCPELTHNFFLEFYIRDAIFLYSLELSKQRTLLLPPKPKPKKGDA